jgi:release factor glutamine methyltransferase
MRKWSVYERNQLRKYGFDENDLDKYGEMPVEYITGHCDFDGMAFEVNKDVLIPRVETIQMVDEAEKLLAGRTEITFAEIGTGCGAIGISLYKRLKKRGVEVRAILAEVSAAALVVARKNLENFVGETDEIELIESDLLSSFPEGSFDLILANLPYIPSSRVSRLPESVVDYEPHLALDGGPEGLTLIKKLLVQAKDRLKTDGALILEIDYSHNIPDFVDVAGYQYEIVRDEFGQNRFLVARLRRRS